MNHDHGLHFIVGVSGDSLSGNETRELAALDPAGVILFKENISDSADWPDRLRALITDIRQAINRPNIVISIDHEGGRVHRLRDPITHFPAAVSWGDRAEEIGQKMGQELSALGINLDYAPSLDVLSEESNRVIGDRSFGGDPVEVAKRGIDFLRGLNSGGVAGCGKHFPGHGGTVKDSHFELPVLNRSEAEIQSIDLPPFIAAIDSGLQLMMTAHVVYPALDKDNPATLSSKIIEGLLRSQLKFNGCVVSDALEMKALSGTEITVLAEKFIRAGGDLFLLGQHDGALTPIEKALELKERLAEHADSSVEFRALLEKSTARIRTFLATIV